MDRAAAVMTAAAKHPGYPGLMNSRVRLIVGGSALVLVLVLATGITIMVRSGGRSPASAERAVEAEMRRLGLRPAGSCTTDRLVLERGSCFIFIAQEDGRCSFATGPAGSVPDRLITVRQTSDGWEMVAVTRLDFFLPSVPTSGGKCEP